MAARPDRPRPAAGPGDERFERMDRRLGNWVVGLLVLLGLWLLVAPLFPRVAGFDFLKGALGSEAGVNRFFLGFLFLYFAGVVKEKNALRETLRGMVALINRYLQQRNRSSVAEAVQILIRSLDSQDPSTRKTVANRLEKLTGQSFGEDRGAWEAWWSENRESFQPDRPPGEEGPAG